MILSKAWTLSASWEKEVKLERPWASRVDYYDVFTCMKVVYHVHVVLCAVFWSNAVP